MYLQQKRYGISSFKLFPCNADHTKIHLLLSAP